MDREIRAGKHKMNFMFYYNNDIIRLRLYYVRYADDWILLTNEGRHVTEMLKSHSAIAPFKEL